MISHLNCDSKVRVLAKGISAVIFQGYLVGWESERLQGQPKKPEPLDYDRVVFCQRCERVFDAKMKANDA